jgi:hypothetical protein
MAAVAVGEVADDSLSITAVDRDLKSRMIASVDVPTPARYGSVPQGARGAIPDSAGEAAI